MRSGFESVVSESEPLRKAISAIDIPNISTDSDPPITSPSRNEINGLDMAEQRQAWWNRHQIETESPQTVRQDLGLPAGILNESIPNTVPDSSKIHAL